MHARAESTITSPTPSFRRQNNRLRRQAIDSTYNHTLHPLAQLSYLPGTTFEESSEARPSFGL
jgi:hypothetical protein